MFTYLHNAVYAGSNLSDLLCWNQPLIFYPSSVVLQQSTGGPSALFAILQSYIIHDCLDSPREVNPHSLLHENILNLVFVLCKRYVFWIDFNDSSQICRFVVTRDRGMALEFLRKTGFVWQNAACLKFVMTLIFACSTDRIGPYIGKDKWAVVGLVWMVLNGSDSDETLREVGRNGRRALLDTRIGVAVANEGILLNPDAKVFIFFDGVHFVVAEPLEGDQLRVWDCENGREPTISPR
jgi:hypothetical protein